MKVIYNKYFPLKNFTAINLFGLIFARIEYKDLEKYELNHEKIHTYQILELVGILYYLLYAIEWLFRLYKQPSRFKRMLVLPKFVIKVLRFKSYKAS